MSENDLTLSPSNIPLTLATLGQQTQIAPASVDDAAFKEMAVTRNFLPRVNLFQAMSKEVTKKKAGSGDFGFTVGKDDMTKLGEKFACIPLAFRFKAVDMRNKEKILNYYDQRTAEFAAVKAVAKEGGMTGCLCGIEFLLWVPDMDQFATFYLSSVSALAEAQNIRNSIFKPAWLKSKLVETKQYSWYVPVCIPCSDPLKEPDIELAKKTIETFTNPKSSEVEAVTEEEKSEAETRAR